MERSCCWVGRSSLPPFLPSFLPCFLPSLLRFPTALMTSHAAHKRLATTCTLSRPATSPFADARAHARAHASPRDREPAALRVWSAHTRTHARAERQTDRQHRAARRAALLAAWPHGRPTYLPTCHVLRQNRFRGGRIAAMLACPGMRACLSPPPTHPPAPAPLPAVRWATPRSTSWRTLA